MHRIFSKVRRAFRDLSNKTPTLNSRIYVLCTHKIIIITLCEPATGTRLYYLVCHLLSLVCQWRTAVRLLSLLQDLYNYEQNNDNLYRHFLVFKPFLTKFSWYSLTIQYGNSNGMLPLQQTYPKASKLNLYFILYQYANTTVAKFQSPWDIWVSCST